jgi:ppGpp synthetase/RelA/SpoT-type nucleotidyltranferase
MSVTSDVPKISAKTLISMPNQPQSDFEEKEEIFKNWYSDNFSILQGAEKAFRNLIQLLASQAITGAPKVISQIKSRDEAVRKFRLKYKSEADTLFEDYEIKDFITDLIGIRLICLYETDIPLAESEIRKHLDVIDSTDKTMILQNDVRAFGYKGLHLDVKLKSDRANLPEYKFFTEMQFELQIRSIVQDAWSEVDHKLKYKKQIPSSLQRRIIRLAALFELADQEFSSIRAETAELEKQAIKSDSTNTNGQGKGSLDSFSFLAMIKTIHPKYNFEPDAIDSFVDQIKSMKSDIDLDYINQADSTFRIIVQDYKHAMMNIININPYTEMRFILYLSDQNTFSKILFSKQARGLDAWLSQNKIIIK